MNDFLGAGVLKYLLGSAARKLLFGEKRRFNALVVAFWRKGDMSDGCGSIGPGAEDGIELLPQSFSWLCLRGHLVLPPDASGAAEVLGRIYVTLGGDLEVPRAFRRPDHQRR